MKIAQVAPLYKSVPPRLYGGTERIVAHLTDGLVKLGHDVTLLPARMRGRARSSLQSATRPSGWTRTLLI